MQNNNEDIKTEDFLTEIPNNDIDDGLIEYEFNSYNSNYSIETLISKYEKGDIIKPNYQREEGIWTDNMCSSLILSIIKGVPIPPIYLFQQRGSSILEIMDGLQRVTALKKFKNDEISVNISGVKSKCSDILKDSKYSSFLNKELAIVRIEQRTPDDNESGKYEIFKLLNRNSVPLTDHEVRKSIYRGEFMNFISQINQNQDWRTIWGKDIKKSRALDEEVLIRAFILRFTSLDKYRNTSKAINNILFYYQQLEDKDKNKLSADIQTAKQIFANTFSFMAKYKCFQGLFSNKAKLDSTLAALMYCIELNKITDIETKFNNLTNDAEYQKYISEGTGDKKSVNGRLNRAKAILLD